MLQPFPLRLLMVAAVLFLTVASEAGELLQNTSKRAPCRADTQFIANPLDLQIEVGTVVCQRSWNQNCLRITVLECSRDMHDVSGTFG